MSRLTWAILTGEYPPQPGGVGDYTRLIASRLAAAGDAVHVWSSPCSAPARADEGVVVHRLPGRFGLRSLIQLGRELDRLPRPHRLLVQYVPHAFGFKAMNLLFCLWLAARPEPVWIMFHEVAFPWGWSRPWKHNLVGLATRVMAAILVRKAEQVLVSIPAWETMLRSLGCSPAAITWSPIPSNVPITPAPEAVALVRQRFGPPPGGFLLGHFGTYGELITTLLSGILPPLLQHNPDNRLLLLGRGGRVFAGQLEREQPKLAGRLIAPDGLPDAELAAHLAACDVLLQPYPDGASSRRSSLMACLALGRPIVTTEGALSEPLWRQSGAVQLAPAGDPAAFCAAAEAILGDVVGRAALAGRGAALYQALFSPDRAIALLHRLASGRPK